ncbi:MAG: hypothetical protein AAF471_00490 [Myxococcota bacterium]
MDGVGDEKTGVKSASAFTACAARQKVDLSCLAKRGVCAWAFLGAVLLQSSWVFAAEAETARQAAQQSDGGSSDANKANSPDPGQKQDGNSRKDAGAGDEANNKKEESEKEENGGALKRVSAVKPPRPDESVSSLPRVQSNLSIPQPEKFVFARVRKTQTDLNELLARQMHLAKKLHALGNNVHAGFETDAKLVIHGKNAMGPRYALQRATYYLDDNPEPIAVMQAPSRKSRTRDETGRLVKGKSGVLFEGFVMPGCHTLRVHAVYRGGEKPFPYKTNVRVTLKGEQSFLAEEGRTIFLEAVSFEDKRRRVKGIAKPDLKFVMAARPNRVKGRPLVDVTDVFNEARLTVTLDNRLMSKSGEKYTLVARRVYVDGAPLSPLGGGGAGREIESDNVVHSGPVALGPHRLDAVLTFRGSGTGYDLLAQRDFSLRFRKDFRAEANGETTVNLVAVLGEADSFQVERKPAIRIKVTQTPAAVGGLKLVNSCKSYEYWRAKKRQAPERQAGQSSQTVAEGR